jgi:signal transduction histidine kinase
VLALGYVLWESNRLIQAQIAEAVDQEVLGLSESFRLGGTLGLVREIDVRARQPGSFLYLVTAPNGQPLTGNVGAIPPGTLDRAGTSEISYSRRDDADAPRSNAHVRVLVLDNGFRVLVGRDLAERGRFAEVLISAILGGIVLVVILGLVGGLFVAVRILARLDAMTETSRTIMAGDLAGRLPVAGTGDEFDRLALATNAMLERIGELMTELRQVTNNVAHDLKTPLTRLRNRADEALRFARTDGDYRSALEQVIEESEGLITTFNAMLIIARAESGAARETMARLDLGEIVESVAELYEPVAEEAGRELSVQAGAGFAILGNRELVAQALANLVDNAIKHGDGSISIALDRRDDRIRLRVADRGAGIAPEDRPRALERFVRLEASRSTPGSGIGLSLAAAIARLHGGTLLIEDADPGLAAILDLPALAD